MITVMETDQAYLFFDGVCGLCNGVVDFLLRYDGQKKLLFVTLQSDFAKKQLPENFTVQLSTLVVKKGSAIYTKSEAVFALAKELGGVFNAVLIFQILPLVFRDFCYDLVAKSRNGIFGKSETCRIPTPEERARFIV